MASVALAVAIAAFFVLRDDGPSRPRAGQLVVLGDAPQPKGFRSAGDSATIVLERDGRDVCLGIRRTKGEGCYWTVQFMGEVRIAALPSDDSDYLVGVAPTDVASLQVEYEGQKIIVPTIGEDAGFDLVAFALYNPESVLPRRMSAIGDDGHVTVLCDTQDDCRETQHGY
jgi:hypothetical protein